MPMPIITDGASQEAVCKWREQTIDPRRSFSMDSRSNTVKWVKVAKKLWILVTILHDTLMLIPPDTK